MHLIKKLTYDTGTYSKVKEFFTGLEWGEKLNEDANEKNALSIGLSCNEGSPVLQEAKIKILTDTGAEVITGSTRMNAGTAHKLVLNILSTCTMVKLGKVYENYMINLKPSNIKLKRGMIRIVEDLAMTNAEKAEELLNQAGWNIRVAMKLTTSIR